MANREYRGTLNGLIMTFGSLGNALGPIVGSATYAAMLPREQGRISNYVRKEVANGL